MPISEETKLFYKNRKSEETKLFYKNRKIELISARTESGMEEIWKQADKDYLPHELGSTKGAKKVLVENERTEVSSYVQLEKNAWRSKVASNNPFIKIQTAIAILFDRNPEAVFDPLSKRFVANTKVVEKLYHRTWTDTNIGAKKELRKFIFNLAKYGWSPARRYYKRAVRKDMNAITRFNLETQDFEFQKRDMVDVDDVFFETKSPFDVWIDDLAKPDDPRSRRDWLWREVFDKMSFEAMLDDLNVDYKVGDFKFSTFTETRDEQKKRFTSSDLIDVYFYENRQKDVFLLESDEKVFFESPITIDCKETSLVDTYWNLRNTDSPYGIGLNEIMRGNKILLDRVKNMTIDQVVLAIYKMVFAANTEQLDDEGGETISIEPGKVKKIINPSNIKIFEIPSPDKEAFVMIEMLEKDIEDDTGITKTLEGEISGKTAFEVAQAQQGALKRLGTPLRNIKSALEWDAKLTVNLMRMIYSVPKVYTILESQLITEYTAAVNNDKDRYFVDEKGQFNALKYREFQLNLEANSEGEFKPTKDKNFLMVKPHYLDWEGEIVIRIESMIEMSKPLERQQKLEMSNLLLPIIYQGIANPMAIPVLIKPAKQILEIYDEDVADWLPEEWLAGQVQMPLMGQGLLQDGQVGQEARRLVPEEQISAPATEMGAVQSAAQQLTP